ncbi:MAG: FAD-dependent oxidoreductase, partial [Planctomycetota bacterium]
RVTAMTEESAAACTFEGGRFRKEPPHSVTVLRDNLDKRFGDQIGAKGGCVVPGYVFDDVIRESDRVVGVRAGSEEIRAKVVIAADGVLSRVARKAGLRGEWSPDHLAVGVKELIGLDRDRLEDRFQLEKDEGEARLFFGAFTRNLFGGAFLYTNRESISLGMVLGLGDLSRKHAAPTPELLEAFKDRPEIRPLVRGGEVLEYSAHLIPEGGLKAATRPFGNGVLVVGDAAGFVINAGLTVRGMEIALVTGALAAETVKRCAEKGDFSAPALAMYKDLLQATPLWRDLETFAEAPEVLSHPPLMRDYPAWACDLLERLFAVGPGPKAKASSELWRFLRTTVLKFGLFADLWKLRRI